MDINCWNCAYYVDRKDGNFTKKNWESAKDSYDFDWGECVYYPPVGESTNGLSFGDFPIVKAFWKCGKALYKEREVRE